MEGEINTKNIFIIRSSTQIFCRTIFFFNKSYECFDACPCQLCKSRDRHFDYSFYTNSLSSVRLVLKSGHKLLNIIRSGVWLDHSTLWICFALNPSNIVLELELLSYWKLNLYSCLKFFAVLYKCSSMTSLCFASCNSPSVLIFLSMLKKMAPKQEGSTMMSISADWRFRLICKATFHPHIGPDLSKFQMTLCPLLCAAGLSAPYTVLQPERKISAVDSWCIFGI